MNLTQHDILRAAELAASEYLESMTVHDVHQIVERTYGAISDNQAGEILDCMLSVKVSV